MDDEKDIGGISDALRSSLLNLGWDEADIEALSQLDEPDDGHSTPDERATNWRQIAIGIRARNLRPPPIAPGAQPTPAIDEALAYVSSKSQPPAPDRSLREPWRWKRHIGNLEALLVVVFILLVLAVAFLRPDSEKLDSPLPANFWIEICATGERGFTAKGRGFDRAAVIVEFRGTPHHVPVNLAPGEAVEFQNPEKSAGYPLTIYRQSDGSELGMVEQFECAQLAPGYVPQECWKVDAARFAACVGNTRTRYRGASFVGQS